MCIYLSFEKNAINNFNEKDTMENEVKKNVIWLIIVENKGRLIWQIN